MAENSNIGGMSDSVTPSTRLLNQKLGVLSAPRMLTPSEIALLRQSKQELALLATQTKYANNQLIR